MTGKELKEACQILLESIGICNENSDFIDALHTVVSDRSTKRMAFLARYPRLEKALWAEIENHINYFPIANDELFQHACALLEQGWAKKEAPRPYGRN